MSHLHTDIHKAGSLKLTWLVTVLFVCMCGGVLQFTTSYTNNQHGEALCSLKGPQIDKEGDLFVDASVNLHKYILGFLRSHGRHQNVLGATEWVNEWVRERKDMHPPTRSPTNPSRSLKGQRHDGCVQCVGSNVVTIMSLPSRMEAMSYPRPSRLPLVRKRWPCCIYITIWAVVLVQLSIRSKKEVPTYLPPFVPLLEEKAIFLLDFWQPTWSKEVAIKGFQSGLSMVPRLVGPFILLSTKELAPPPSLCSLRTGSTTIVTPLCVFLMEGGKRLRPKTVV